MTTHPDPLAEALEDAILAGVEGHCFDDGDGRIDEMTDVHTDALRAALDAAGYEVAPKGAIAAERARIWSSAIDYSYVVGWPPDEIAALRTIIEGADDVDAPPVLTEVPGVRQKSPPLTYRIRGRLINRDVGGRSYDVDLLASPENSDD